MEEPLVHSEPEASDERPGRAPLGWIVLLVLLLVGVPFLALEGLRLQRLADEEALRFEAYLDGVEARMAAVPLLTDRETALLRRSLNARHVALARELGITPLPDRDALDGIVDDLVALDDDDAPYVARRATYSVPYVTPGAARALDSLAAAFRGRLDAAELPHFRLVLTSVLRTAADQAALRGVNVNAAQGRSSHEFATTFDVHAERFRYDDPGALLLPRPSDDLPRFLRDPLAESFERRTEDAFAALAEQYPSRLKALLGRALIGLEDRGVVVTVLERRQPVFHTTVARRLPGPGTTAAP